MLEVSANEDRGTITRQASNMTPLGYYCKKINNSTTAYTVYRIPCMPWCYCLCIPY